MYDMVTYYTFNFFFLTLLSIVKVKKIKVKIQWMVSTNKKLQRIIDIYCLETLKLRGGIKGEEYFIKIIRKAIIVS